MRWLRTTAPAGEREAGRAPAFEEADEAYEDVRRPPATWGRPGGGDLLVTAGINILAHSPGNRWRRATILLSVLEHQDLVPGRCRQARQTVKAPVTPTGIDLNSLGDLSPRTRLVRSRMAQRLGAITDAAAVSALVHEKRAYLVLDGAQAYARSHRRAGARRGFLTCFPDKGLRPQRVRRPVGRSASENSSRSSAAGR